MGHTQNGQQNFLAEITKTDHPLSESFYFISKYFLAEFMNLFQSWPTIVKSYL